MRIVGIEGLTPEQIAQEVQRGGRFVFYKYVVSILVMTFQRPTDIHFIRAGESAVAKGASYSAISLVCGWWGIPWGPIFTIGSVATNLSGGKDVTREVLASFYAMDLAAGGPPSPAPVQ